MRIGKVRRYFRNTLYLAQSLLEEIACFSIFLTILCSFLCSHKVSIGKALWLYLPAVHQVTQLIQEQVKRSTVEYQMMHISQEIYILFSSDNLHAIQRSLSQVKRLDELHHVFLYFGFAYLALFNHNRLVNINYLYDFAFLTVEMHVELRVGLDDGLYRLLKQLNICSLWETYCCRDVIHR